MIFHLYLMLLGKIRGNYLEKVRFCVENNLIQTSSDDIFITPMATACSFPSAIMATSVPCGRPSVIFAPGLVRPGHMMLEPLSTNFMAPLSTYTNNKLIFEIFEAGVQEKRNFQKWITLKLKIAA